MARGTSSLLRELEHLKIDYGGSTARRKLELLRALERQRLGRAREIFRLHEVLCFLRAYPDDADVLSQVERMLLGFARRGDLRRHSSALSGTGIAGTEIRYSFFAPTASWLARRWGRYLEIDWKEFDKSEELDPLLPMLALYSETPGLDELAFGVRGWVERLKGPEETDGAFLVRRFDALRMEPLAREILYDSLDVPLRLAPGPDTPSRTRAKYRGASTEYQKKPLSPARPSIRKEIDRPPLAIRSVTPRQSRELVDLARGMMVTLNRELDVFSHAYPRDVRIADCGGGLQFAFIGAVPERRLMLEALYGYVILKSGVPLGYGTASTLFGSSEVAYNVSETFRRGESALIFGRLLASIRRLFGSDTFTLDPYQLGEGNEEALQSGAWWFYQKLGFRAREVDVLGLMRRELRRMEAAPGHRSSAATLKRLAKASVYLHLGRRRDGVIGILPLANVGLRVTRYLAERFGSDRERAARECSPEAARLLGVRSLRGWSSGERLAWERWAPLVLVLPGVKRWSRRDRRALADVIRAKGGGRESDYIARFDRHERLRQAVRELASGES